MDTSHNRRLGAALLALAVYGSPAVMAQAAPDQLFQDLGQEAGIGLIVDRMLVLVGQDARIREAFKDTNMKRLAKLLKEQFCAISNGPCHYSGDDMKTVHDKMGIRSAQFNALAEDLQLAMEQLDIPAAIQNKLLARLAPMKRDIVAPE